MNSGEPGSGEAAGGINDGLALGRVVQGGQESGSRPSLDERRAQTVAGKVVDQRLLAETNFGLGGMDIDIHFFGGHFEEQEDDGEAGGRQHVAIRLGDGMQQQAIADKPLVDKNIDRVAIELLQLGPGVEAGEAQRAWIARRLAGSCFQGGGSGRPAWAKGVSAATGSSCASVSLPKIW